MNPLEIIPPELISKILADLNARDLCNVALTSKGFYSAVSDPFLWKTAKISKKTAIERGVPSLMEIPRFRNHRDLDFSREAAKKGKRTKLRRKKIYVGNYIRISSAKYYFLDLFILDVYAYCYLYEYYFLDLLYFYNHLIEQG